MEHFLFQNLIKTIPEVKLNYTETNKNNTNRNDKWDKTKHGNRTKQTIANTKRKQQTDNGINKTNKGKNNRKNDG